MSEGLGVSGCVSGSGADAAVSRISLLSSTGFFGTEVVANPLATGLSCVFFFLAIPTKQFTGERVLVDSQSTSADGGV